MNGIWTLKPCHLGPATLTAVFVFIAAFFRTAACLRGLCAGTKNTSSIMCVVVVANKLKWGRGWGQSLGKGFSGLHKMPLLPLIP